MWLTATLTRISATSTAWLWAGVLLSSTLQVLALVVFQHLCAHVSNVNPRAAAWLLALYPFSVFYGLPYTESLFLLSALGTWHAVVRGKSSEAGVYGIVAGLTRPNGWLLSVPCVLLTLRDKAVQHKALVFACLAPVAGMLIYSAYVLQLTNEAFAWATAQAGWGRAVRNPLATLLDVAGEVKSFGFWGYVVTKPYDFANLLALLTAVGLSPVVSARFGLAYGAYMFINVALAFAAGGLPSMGRYTSVLFPMFMWIASWRNRAAVYACLLVFAVAYCLIAALFFTWRVPAHENWTAR